MIVKTWRQRNSQKSQLLVLVNEEINFIVQNSFRKNAICNFCYFYFHKIIYYESGGYFTFCLYAAPSLGSPSTPHTNLPHFSNTHFLRKNSIFNSTIILYKTFKSAQIKHFVFLPKCPSIHN